MRMKGLVTFGVGTFFGSWLMCKACDLLIREKGHSAVIRDSGDPDEKFEGKLYISGEGQYRLVLGIVHEKEDN